MIVERMSSAGIGALLRDQIEPVVAQLHGILARDDLARGLGNAGVDPLGKLDAFLLRNAEQETYRLQRQVAGETSHEIERLVLRHRLDQRHGAAAQLSFERQNGAGRKALVDERPEALVLGVIHPDEHRTGLPFVLQPRATLGAIASLVRREGRRIRDHRHGIVVAAHHPEALALWRMLRRLVPIDGSVLRAQVKCGCGKPCANVALSERSMLAD